jgi:hypothetical protein
MRELPKANTSATGEPNYGCQGIKNLAGTLEFRRWKLCLLCVAAYTEV